MTENKKERVIELSPKEKRIHMNITKGRPFTIVSGNSPLKETPLGELLLTDEEIGEVVYMAIESPDKFDSNQWKEKEIRKCIAKAQLAKLQPYLQADKDKAFKAGQKEEKEKWLKSITDRM